MAREFERGAKIERWERKLENPTDALKQIGALMVAESQRAFKLQRFGREKWKERSTPNVFGIIADFHAGKKKPPARRFESRPALRDTGALARSIAFKLAGAKVVEVGSVLPYAGTLHHGGEVESKPITETVQTALWKWLKGPGKEHKSTLGWLLNKKFTGQKLTTTVPKRPIVGITKQTIADVREAVRVKIMEVK